ncbi:hypothetical protein ABWL39_10720 [Chitinivorax sp. PXF-14]|uniref:hypothetical protein n=1 Tax=Chitinivorax sp. PXF-14 TaxID=3230488 RepID=UPI003467380E
MKTDRITQFNRRLVSVPTRETSAVADLEGVSERQANQEISWVPRAGRRLLFIERRGGNDRRQHEDRRSQHMAGPFDTRASSGRRKHNRRASDCQESISVKV